MASPSEEKRIKNLGLLLHDLANCVTSLQLELELAGITGDIDQKAYHLLISQLSRVTDKISEGQGLLKELEH